MSAIEKWGTVALFITVFLCLGVMLPYMPAWYSSLSSNPANAGYIITLFFFVRTVFSPVISWYMCNESSMYKVFFILGSASLVSAVMLLASAHNMYALFIMTCLFSVSTSALMPMAEFYGYQSSQKHAIDYGFMRMTGTVSFAIMTLLCGYAISGYGEDSIIVMQIILFCVIISICIVYTLLPRMACFKEHYQNKRSVPDHHDENKVDDIKGGWADMVRVARMFIEKRYLLPVISLVFLQASHVVYYGFSVIHWTHIGYSEAMSGALWGVGALSEAVFFVCASVLAKRVTPYQMILAGGIGSSFRWLVMSFDPHLVIAFFIQLLHVCSFAMVHMGTMLFVDRIFPKKISGVAISLLFSLMNLFVTVLMVLVSYLYEEWRGYVYLISFLVSLTGVVFCVIANPFWHVSCEGKG